MFLMKGVSKWQNDATQNPQYVKLQRNLQKARAPKRSDQQQAQSLQNTGGKTTDEQIN